MSEQKYRTYYHHTDINSAMEILSSGYIKQSEVKQGDAAFGEGTYLTKLGPKASRRKVARNNYDGFWKRKLDEGKTDVAIKLKVPKASVQPCDSGDRDVHVYEGDLELSDAKHVDVIVREEGGGLVKHKFW